MGNCYNCGSKLKKNNKFCPECGMVVIGGEESQAEVGGNRHRKQVALIVAILIVVAATVFLLMGVTWDQNAIGAEHEIMPETVISQITFSDDPNAITTASQSVVKLNCYNKSGELYATGSGFACFADNVIVTNYHVIEGYVYSIKVVTEDGWFVDVEYILAADKEKDIAILMTSVPHDLALLQPGESSTLQKGEKVVAIGSPLGLLNSVSTGVFSGYVLGNGMSFLQFTASISSGSSGGALFNDHGEVLGITFASYEAGQNLNLAIPIEQVQQIYSNSDVSGKTTVADFYSANVGPVVICNVETKEYHPGICYDTRRANMNFKYGINNGIHICLTESDAKAFGYTMCPNCANPQ